MYNRAGRPAQDGRFTYPIPKQASPACQNNELAGVRQTLGSTPGPSQHVQAHGWSAGQLTCGRRRSP
jgi:hypothetical protein